jgi:hypothetical protein
VRARRIGGARALFTLVYGGAERYGALAMELGLAGTSLISATAQIAVLVGLWLVWMGAWWR